MKKLLTISLLTLAMVLLIVSCSAENNTVEDELAVISFDASENATRSLTRTNSVFNASELYWYYTAEKKDSTGLTTGQTVTNGVLTKTAVNTTTVDNTTTVNKGLKPVGSFSYGDWEFVLYGCTEANPEKVAYQSEKTLITINKATTALKVFVTAQQTGSGTLEFPLKSAMVKLGDAAGTAATLGTDVVERITFKRLDATQDDIIEYNYTSNDDTATARRKTLNSGSYSVTFSYLTNYTVGEATESSAYDYTNAYAVAEETIYVSIKDNQVTTIGGDITESTGEVDPRAVEAEAKITASESVTYYESFIEAVNAATAADTVTLLNSVTLSSSETISKSLTVDLGGKILTLGSGVELKFTSSSDSILVTIKNGTIDGEGYIAEDSSKVGIKLEGVTFAANRKSTWDGTSYTWESDYATNNSTGFLKKDSNGGVSLSDSLNETTCVTNAKSFIEYFDSNLVKTGKIQFATIPQDVRTATGWGRIEVTVSSADALASLGLLQKYFSAKCIVTASENSNNLINDYYYCCCAGMEAKIIVVADMDLNSTSYNWNPVTCEYRVDFNGHTVSDLKCENAESDGMGLFNQVYGVSNLVLANATVTGKQSVGAVTGSSTGFIKNVTVKDSTVTGVKYVGGVIGYAYADITDCKVENTTVKTGTATKMYQVGGIVGFECQGTVSGCSVSGSTITAGSCEAGGIAGRAYIQSAKDIVIKNNTVTNTTVKADETTAVDFIGTSSAYAGLICGGNYLGLESGNNTYNGNPSKDNTGTCIISGNTVNGITY